MRFTQSRRILCMAWGLGLTWCLTPSLLGNPEVCCPSPDFPDYGDGSDGTIVISSNTQLTQDKNYEDLTIQPGVTLDTCGHILRVCGRLLNRGIITDTCSGGEGGDGGAAGLGADPYQHHDPPGCPFGGDDCSNGQQGGSGHYPSPSQAGENGRGGRGGGGGGGGGGAWYGGDKLPDADGGDGGAGGKGGKGGGYVRMYAYRFDNQGVIHADGEDGEDGDDAPNGYSNCGAEYYLWQVIPRKDYAGGGGGGGGGGAGGNGGTVEIYYGELLNHGIIRANDGSGESGGQGGARGGCLDYGGGVSGDSSTGCSGGTGGGHGGRGGDGTHVKDTCAGNGGDGTQGPSGANGTWSVTARRQYCKIGLQCYWNGDENPGNECQECNAAVSMTEWSNKLDGTACDDGLFCNGADTCASGSCVQHAGDPCDCDFPDSDCTDCCNEAQDNCTGNEPSGSPCDDGLYCNGTDTCNSSGSCSNHTGDPCNCDLPDSNCTDCCNEAQDNCTGNEPSGSPCDDGLYCNGTDTCNGSGSCSNHTGDPCVGGEECNDCCNEGSDNCYDPLGSACGDPSDTDCDNPDTCDGAGTCQPNHEPNGTGCDDGFFCTATDECDGAGTCAGFGDPCEGGPECNHICNEDTDDCYNAAGTACGDPGDTDCDNPDTCDEAGTCLDNHEPSGTSCNDGLFCNGADACSGGTCSRHAGYPCGGNEWCDDSVDVCVGYGDGDFEPGSDVDLADFAEFQMCFDLEIVSGSACEPANMTGMDGKIDLDDYAAFHAAITGPNH